MYTFFRHPVYIFSTQTTVVLFYFFYMVFKSINNDKGLYFPHRDLPNMNFNEHPTPTFLKSYIQRSVMQWSEASRAHEVVSSFKRRPCFVGKEREAISFHSDLWSTDQPSAPSPYHPWYCSSRFCIKSFRIKRFLWKGFGREQEKKGSYWLYLVFV